MQRLWLVTFVTHNSRISARMRVYRIQPGIPAILCPSDQVLVASAIFDAAQHHGIAVAALNVLPDHVHLIIAARDEKQLGEFVRKLKGYSAYQFRLAHPEVTDTKLWAQKFNRKPIRSEKELALAMQYVHDDHFKQVNRWGKQLVETWEDFTRDIVASRCVPVREIFGIDCSPRD